MAGIIYKIGVNIKEFTDGMGEAGVRLAKFTAATASTTALTAATVGLGAGLAAAGTAATMIGIAIKKAADRETLEGMVDPAASWNGMMEKLKENIDEAFVALGQPIMEELKPFLASAAEYSERLAGMARRAGEAVATSIAYVKTAFSQGVMGDLIGTTLKLGFMEGVNVLWKSINGVLGAFGQVFFEQIKNAITLLQIITTADFWKGMGYALSGTILSAVALFQTGMAAALEVLRPALKLLRQEGKLDAAKNSLLSGAAEKGQAAKDLFGHAGTSLEPAFEKATQRIKDAAANIAKAYQDSYSGTKDLLGTEETKAHLKELNDAIMESVHAQRKSRVNITQPKAEEADDDPSKQSARSRNRISADRLAQIGGYVGSTTASISAKAAEKTEQWTRKSAEHLATLVRNSHNTNSGVFA